MQLIIKKIKKLYPDLKFQTSDYSFWSPNQGLIYYANETKSDSALWSLLHEVGHALANHTSYDADYMLLRLEIEAWEKAKTLSKKLSISIPEAHIEDCLDTYRDWLYRRSVCPTCSAKCFQQSDFHHYKCFNCHTVWKVSPSRFCRSYRSTKNQEEPIGILI